MGTHRQVQSWRVHGRNFVLGVLFVSAAGGQGMLNHAKQCLGLKSLSLSLPQGSRGSTNLSERGFRARVLRKSTVKRKFPKLLPPNCLRTSGEPATSTSFPMRLLQKTHNVEPGSMPAFCINLRQEWKITTLGSHLLVSM